MECPSLKDLPPPPAGKMGWPWTEESARLSKNMSEGHSWPRVSIVSPSYNQNEFLEETIRSVLLQGYPDLEYIIMDGGSTDGSVDIIRKYEPWLAYWVSAPDQGQTHAINTGWKRATGTIRAYINSDDFYLPEAIAVAVNGLYARPEAGMVYGSALVIDQSGEELRMWKAEPFDLKKMLTSGSIIPQPASFFTEKALERAGYLDEQWNMIMDYEISVRIGMMFPTVCLPVVLAKFRDHAQSKTHLHYEKIADELLQWLEVISPPHVTPEQWQMVKQIMRSRVYYEWAGSYVSRGREQGSKALPQLMKSIYQYPSFALKRPADTAYLVKEIFLSFVTANHVRQRMPYKNSRVTRD